MRVTISMLPMIVLLGVATATAQVQHAAHGLPAWADSALVRAGLGQRFELSSSLNPELGVGDFDGDGYLDLAVKVVDGERRRILAVVHRGTRAVHLLGVGRLPTFGGWGVFAPRFRDDRRFVFATGRDLLFVAVPGTATAWAAWNGESYDWIQ